uniref:Reverse transcriptase domain-containing protein n=1 Tax=Tanacetum cinerariifolium TaxID=118510 RepID=A0A6L2NS59_TANCI|nr:hypothetical protein [Tanacetum cinerariifolium]
MVSLAVQRLKNHVVFVYVFLCWSAGHLQTQRVVSTSSNQGFRVCTASAGVAMASAISRFGCNTSILTNIAAEANLRMPPKRRSTSAASAFATPTMTQAAIRQLVIDSVTVLAVLCPKMAPNTEKLIESFIRGLPQSIEGTVTASKPQTLEEAANIAQRLMDQVTKHNSVQGTNDHKRKFDDRRSTTTNNNYPNNRVNNYQNNHNNNSNRNNDYRQQQNKRPKTFRDYAATPTENNGYT